MDGLLLVSQKFNWPILITKYKSDDCQVELSTGCMSPCWTLSSWLETDTWFVIFPWLNYALWLTLSTKLIHALQKPGGLMFPDSATLFMAGLEDQDYKEEKINCMCLFIYPATECVIVNSSKPSLSAGLISLGWCLWIWLLLHQRDRSTGTLGWHRWTESSDYQSLCCPDLWFAYCDQGGFGIRSPIFPWSHSSRLFVPFLLYSIFFFVTSLTILRVFCQILDVHALLGWFDVSFRACHKPVSFSTGPHAKYTHCEINLSSRVNVQFTQRRCLQGNKPSFTWRTH
jgi:hypothetical protein